MQRQRSVWLIIASLMLVAACGPEDTAGDERGPDGAGGPPSEEVAPEPGPTDEEAREAFTVVYSVAVHAVVQAALGREADGLNVDQAAREIVVRDFPLGSFSDVYERMSGRLESDKATALSGVVSLSGGPIASLEIDVPAIDSRDGARAAAVVADGILFDLEFDAEPLRRP